MQIQSNSKCCRDFLLLFGIVGYVLKFRRHITYHLKIWINACIVKVTSLGGDNELLNSFTLLAFFRYFRYPYSVLFKVLLYALVKSLSTSDLAIELELTLYWRTSAHCSFTVVVRYVSRSSRFMNFLDQFFLHKHWHGI